MHPVVGNDAEMEVLKGTVPPPSWHILTAEVYGAALLVDRFALFLQEQLEILVNDPRYLAPRDGDSAKLMKSLVAGAKRCFSRCLP